MFSYKPLFKLLIEKEITKTQMRIDTKIGMATLAKFAKGEYVSMEVLDKICNYLDCNIEDIVEHIKD